MVTCTLYYEPRLSRWNTRVKSLYHILAILVVTSLFGCTTTSVETPAPPSHLGRLLAANNRPLSLEVIDDVGKAPVGFQYLLVAIPFGRITLDDAADHLRRALRTQLAMAGFSLEASENIPSLRVKITEVELNAFDLLVTRRIRCHVKGSWAFGPHGEQQLSVAQSEFALYAFAPRLSRVLGGCMQEFATKISQEIKRRPHRLYR